MSDLTITGGAGGVGARLQDLRSQAGLLDAAGDDVRRWSGSVAAVALHTDVTVATLLCPVEVASVAGAVAGATIGVNGLLVVSTGLEGTAVVLRASATTYEFVDASAQAVLEQLQNAAGFALGSALPLLAVGGGLLLVGGAGVALATPVTWPALVLAARTVDLGGIGDTAMRGLYDNPWLMDGLIRLASGLLQGTTWGVGSMLGGPAGGFVLPFALSGGKWPTPSYEDAVGGLVNAGGLFGMFQDAGRPGVALDGIDLDGSWAPRSIEGIFDQQGALGADQGKVQIVKVPHEDGTASYIVQIPGTQEWGPTRGDHPIDLTTNVRLMAGDATLMQHQVALAMREAGIGPGDAVMLTGHSQGGITAAALASDAGFRDEFDVRAVVTGGSPIGRYDIPDSVAVLALEHDQDAVPLLEGRGNPDRPHWLTVGRDISGSPLQVPSEEDPGDLTTLPDGPAAAHRTEIYAQTGAAIDASADPGVQAWLAQNQQFFDGGHQSATRWDVGAR
jgi:hypothetical protein